MEFSDKELTVIADAKKKLKTADLWQSSLAVNGISANVITAYYRDYILFNRLRQKWHF